jgi:hypothetical protein
MRPVTRITWGAATGDSDQLRHRSAARLATSQDRLRSRRDGAGLPPSPARALSYRP